MCLILATNKTRAGGGGGHSGKANPLLNECETPLTRHTRPNVRVLKSDTDVSSTQRKPSFIQRRHRESRRQAPPWFLSLMCFQSSHWPMGCVLEAGGLEGCICSGTIYSFSRQGGEPRGGRGGDGLQLGPPGVLCLHPTPPPRGSRHQHCVVPRRSSNHSDCLEGHHDVEMKTRNAERRAEIQSTCGPFESSTTAMLWRRPSPFTSWDSQKHGTRCWEKKKVEVHAVAFPSLFLVPTG